MCYHCYVILAILHLGLLEDISLAQIYCADLNSVVFFLLSCCYLFSKWNIFFSLSRLYSFFFCLSPLLSFYLSPLLLSTFYLSSSHILSLSPSASFFVYLLLSCCLLSFFSDFPHLSSAFSFCFCLFLCLLLFSFYFLSFLFT